MDFKIFYGNSDALRELIYARGWQNRESFSLNIPEGPLLSYFRTWFHDMGEFHVGCSDDERPPNFYFNYNQKLKLPRQLFSLRCLEGKKSIAYSRYLFEKVCWRNGWFHDKRGKRDLERVAEAFSNPENYEEDLTVGFDINRRISAGVSECGTSQYITLTLRKGVFLGLHGLYNIINKEKRTEFWFGGYSPYELDDFIRPNGFLDLKHSSYSRVPEFGYEFLEMGVTLSDLVGELFYVGLGHQMEDSIIKSYNFEKEKSVRDSVLAKIPVANREWLLKEGVIKN